MFTNRALRLWGLLLFTAFLGACGSKSKDTVAPLVPAIPIPPGVKNQAFIRLTAKSLQGLDAQYTFYRQKPNETPVLQSAGPAQDNAVQEIEGGILEAGETAFVEISFRAITPTHTATPAPDASYTAEVALAGKLKTRVIINAASRLNNTYYLAAVAKVDGE